MNKSIVFQVWLFSILSIGLLARDSAILRIDVKAGEAEGVIRVNTKVGIATAFEFPGTEKIRDMILGDPKFWVAESNGRVGVVRQLKAGAATSLFIFTNRDILYTFLLGEGAGDGVVKVKIENPEAEKIFEGSLISHPQASPSMQGEEPSEPRRMKVSYKIKDKHFKVEACFDNGVITTIQLDRKAQIKPAVFLSREKDKLEQIKYTEEDGIYKIHYVLGRQEFFVLKEGKKVSIIGS